MSDHASDQLKCHHCASSDLRVAEPYTRMWRVTSDCKPWPPGGMLARCHACGLVQTAATPQWSHEADRIYAGYTIYHQSGGIEQAVFDSSSGASQARSDILIKAVQTHVPFQQSGRWLDIGCGNGALLRACSRALPGWKFLGSEVNDKYRDAVESIPGVEALVTGALSSVPGTYDVISLVHVLEHIPAPAAFLKSLSDRLNPDGRILIEVPDCRQNPFMLMVADHCSHFSRTMLANVVATAGYSVLHAVDNWVPKELSAIATRATESAGLNDVMRESEEVWLGWTFLERVAAEARQSSNASHFGIFGTSIAATWLDAEIDHQTRFFVDEDPNRVGRTHLGKPILAPKQIPDGACVYIPLPKLLVEGVRRRVAAIQPHAQFLTP